jgi:NAD(P)-dependent dehydrogenase (short-subunit alcohol dehydrogenase family)
LRARWVAAERSSATPLAAGSTGWVASESFIADVIVTLCQCAGQGTGAAWRRALPSRHRIHSATIMTSPSNTAPTPLRVAITGGTSGLGRALAEAFAARGDVVAFVARDPARVRRVAAAIAGSHGIVGDVANKQDIHAIALQIGGALGALDVLVNNASSLGPVPLALLADTECEDFELALATNLLGPFRLTKALLGALAAAARAHAGAQRSLVVNISSDAAVTPYGGWGAYGASKAALAHMSRIWNDELAPHGVAVIAVDPGDMDTPLHAAALPDADPATLKRPRDAAREIIERIDRERLAASEPSTA